MKHSLAKGLFFSTLAALTLWPSCDDLLFKPDVSSSSGQGTYKIAAHPAVRPEPTKEIIIGKSKSMPRGTECPADVELQEILKEIYCITGKVIQKYAQYSGEEIISALAWERELSHSALIHPYLTRLYSYLKSKFKDIRVTSGVRTKGENERLRHAYLTGAYPNYVAKDSKHLTGEALDLKCKNSNRLENAIKIFDRDSQILKTIRYRSHIHVQVD